MQMSNEASQITDLGAPHLLLLRGSLFHILRMVSTCGRPLCGAVPSGGLDPVSSRWILLLWKALATNYHLARDVITLLYVKLKLRPPRRLLHSSYQARLVSLMVSRTLCFATSMVPSGSVVVSRASEGSHEDTGLPPRAPPSSLYHGLWSFVTMRCTCS